MTTTQQPRLAYSPAEVAARIGLPYSSVTALIRCGELHALRAGKHYRIPATELDRWLADGAAA